MRFSHPRQHGRGEHLRNSRQHLLAGEYSSGLVCQVQTPQASQGKQRAGDYTLVQLPHARLHIAAEIHHLHKNGRPLPGQQRRT